MAEIPLKIPNDQIDRVVNALCLDGGYVGDPDDQASRREFALSVIREDLRQKVLRVERTQAAALAMAGVTVDPITVE